jgi:hypothetical protein
LSKRFGHSILLDASSRKTPKLDFGTISETEKQLRRLLKRFAMVPPLLESNYLLI